MRENGIGLQSEMDVGWVCEGFWGWGGMRLGWNGTG